MRGSNRRRYFTEVELAKLIKAAREGRYGQRDATLILLMARHGLRVSEAVDLEWDQIDFTRAHLHVRRLKGGIASVQGPERAYRMLTPTCFDTPVGISWPTPDTIRGGCSYGWATRTLSTPPITPSLAQSRSKTFGKGEPNRPVGVSQIFRDVRNLISIREKMG